MIFTAITLLSVRKNANNFFEVTESQGEKCLHIEQVNNNYNTEQLQTSYNSKFYYLTSLHFLEQQSQRWPIIRRQRQQSLRSLPRQVSSFGFRTSKAFANAFNLLIFIRFPRYLRQSDYNPKLSICRFEDKKMG